MASPVLKQVALIGTKFPAHLIGPQILADLIGPQISADLSVHLSSRPPKFKNVKHILKTDGRLE